MAVAGKGDWIAIQQSTFTKWCNARLDGSGAKIADLLTDLDDGVKLAVLLERLANRKVSTKIRENPRNPWQRTNNLQIVLDFIQNKEKIHLVNIGPEDITAHNQRLILGLIWTLILHYQIHGAIEDGREVAPISDKPPNNAFGPVDPKPVPTTKKTTKPPPPKKLLLNWLQAAMPEDQPVKNLTSDWSNGQRLSALIETMKPGTIPNYRALRHEDALASTEQALDIAKSELDIPKIIDPDHVCVKKPDERSMMTYLSYFCSGKESPGYRSLLTWVRSKISEYNIVDFTGDWRDGRALSALVNAVAEGTLPNHATLDPSKRVDNVRAAMKTATDNLDGIENNITPEEFADKDTRALAMMGYIEWFRKAKPKQSLSVVGPGVHRGIPVAVETYLHVKGLASPGSLMVKVIGPEGQDVSVSTSPSDNINPNFHTFRYVPTKPGKHTVNIDNDGVPVPGSPFFPVIIGKVDPNKCVAEGPGLLAGRVSKPTHFTVDCRRAGPGELKVDIRSPSGTAMPATVSGVKKFDIEYTPAEIGPHNIVVLFADHQIRGSPFTAIVTDPSKVIVEGLHDSKTDETTQFSVQTEEAGPGKLDVSVRGPTGPIPCTMEDVDKNVYQCAYTPVEDGPHTIRVLFAEEDVPGSPFTTMVRESCYPDKVVLRDLPHGNLKAGHKHSITANTTETGNGTLSALLNGPSGSVLCSIKEEQQEIYSITFEPTKAGTYKLDVQYSGNPVHDSPVSFYAVDPSSIRVTPPTVSILGVFITEHPYKYHVKASETVEKVTAKARGRNTGDEPTVNRTESGDGEYDITLTAAKPDDYDVDIYCGSDPVPGSPYHLQVLEKPHPDRVRCGTLVPEDPVWMSVDISKAGAGKLTAACKCDKYGDVPCTVTDSGRGKQQVSFKPPASDVYWVSVYWNNTEVPRSPFRVSTVPTDASKVCVDGPHYPQMHEGPVTAVCDVSDAGDGTLTASCHSKYGEVPVQVSEQVNRKVEVQFAPSGRGHYELNVLWQEDNVPGSPFNINLDPPNHSKVGVDGPYAPKTGLGLVHTSIDVSEAGDGELAVTAEGDRVGHVDVSITQKGAKNYAAVFDAKEPDTYNVSVLWSGQHVPRSPFSVCVDLGEELVTIEDYVPDNASYQTGPLPYDDDEDPTYHEPKSAEAIPVFHIGELVLVDVDKEDEEHTGPVTASCQGDDFGWIPVELIANPDGAAQVSINPRKPDLYTVVIKMGDEHVPGSPFKLCYRPQTDRPSDASKCKVYGLPIAKKKLVSHEEIVYGVDASGAGPGNLSVQSEGPSEAKKSSKLQIMSTDGADFRIVYTPGSAGTHKHFIHWNKEPIPDSPVVFEVEPRDIPVYPFGPVTMDFVFPGIKATDISGHVTYEPTGKKLKLNVKRNKTERDKIQVSFKPTDPGLYEVNVYNSKVPVKGSPFEVHVLEPADASKVRVTGLTDIVCHVGNKVPFTLDCTDAGSGQLHVRCEGPTSGSEQAPLHIAKKKNNCYDGTFSPSSEGDHLIHFQWSDKLVPGSPFKVKVLPEKGPEVARRPRLTILELGQPIDIKVTDKADDEVYASAVGDNTGPAHVNVQLDENDRHQVLFQPLFTDDYTLTVMLNNSLIDGSPFRIKVLEKTTVFVDANLKEGAPQKALEAEVNKPVNFVFSPGPISDSPAMSVSGPSGPVLPEVSHTGDGRYIAHFKPEEEGEYLVSAQCNGEHLKGSPYMVLVRDSNKSDPSKCFILSEDLEVMSKPYKLNQPCRFSVSTVNAGTGTLKVTHRGPAHAEVNITDNRDDVYTITFTPSAPGKYSLDVTWDNIGISGSPFLVVYNGERKPRILTGLDLHKVPFWVDKPRKFKVHCDDLGEGEFSITVEPPSAATIKTRDLGQLGRPQTYHVTLVPKEPGKHQVSVTHSNEHIQGSPFLCTFAQEEKAKPI